MKLIIDIDNNDYELINKIGVTLDLNTVFHGKEKDKEMTLAIFDLVKALKNGTPYEERPQGKWIDHSEDYGYVECPFCHELTSCSDNADELHYCWSCGAKLGRGGAEE